jgi:hypothetical protein
MQMHRLIAAELPPPEVMQALARQARREQASALRAFLSAFFSRASL